jgi:MFS family permease
MTVTTGTLAPPTTRPGWTRALCWATVTLEGFDIVALSASLPTILDTGHVGIGKAEATFVTTISLVGILVGALLVGPVADRFGRKSALMGSIALFSVLTLAVPWAPDVTTFATLRFLAGIGLGACMPVALTTMSETVPLGQRARGTTLAMTGYHTGALLTALVGLAVMPTWEWLFVLGGVAGLLVLPVMWVRLPETNQRVVARRSGADGADRADRVPLSALLKQPFLVASLATWVASFMGLLLVYGLISWLPTIMSEAGYELSTSLVMLFLLNLGGVAGLVLAGFVGDARGIRPSAIGWFVASAASLALLSVKMPTLLLDVAVFVTGVFVFSAQVLVYAWITRCFPADIRGTALGLASGVGRVGSIVGPAITGALVTAGIAYPWGFYFFSGVAVLAVLAMAAVPRGLEQPESRPTAPATTETEALR